MQEVEEEINHHLKQTRKECRIKSKIVQAGEVKADNAIIPSSAKGKAIGSSSSNLVFMLLVLAYVICQFYVANTYIKHNK